jgi:hypothetical protein
MLEVIDKHENFNTMVLQFFKIYYGNTELCTNLFPYKYQETEITKYFNYMTMYNFL